MTWEKLQAEGRKRVERCLLDWALEIPYAPGFDTVLVVRLPPPPTVKQIGAIIVPEKFQEEPEPKSEGVLIAAGLKALDHFRDHGYVVGDRVQIGRFAGWEKEFELDKKGESKRKILQLTSGDLHGSFDLKERLWGKKPTMEVYWDEEREEHRIRPIV